ncbi:MAG: hypothetical protein ABFS43_16435 [Thermodesulfobacteriota bacterium]
MCKYELLRAAAIQGLGEEKGRELVPALTFHGPYMALPGLHDPAEGIPANQEFPVAAGNSDSEFSDQLITSMLRADDQIRRISGLQGNQVHSNLRRTENREDNCQDQPARSDHKRHS